MFENNAKGWHGSYSIVGRSSAEKYHLILIKDLILSERVKKKKVKTLFSPDENIKDEKEKTENKTDIFEEPPIREKLDKIREDASKRKEICEPYSSYHIPERYKYHQHHHRELHNYNTILSQNKKYSGSNYNPKRDYIWKKTITGPSWDIMSGREKKDIKIKEYLNSNKNSKNKMNDFKNKNSLTFDNNLKLNKNNDKNQFSIVNNIKRMNETFVYNGHGVPMIKQTRRGDLPITYDLRIRNDKPFEIKENDINNANNTFIKKGKEKKNILKNKKELTNLKKLNIKNYRNKERVKINHCIDFSKGLTRQQYNKLYEIKKDVHPLSIPNYSQVEPRCLTMVSYNSKKNRNIIKKYIKGVDNTLFYDPDKIINKVNNHKEVSVPNFKIMVSRPDDQGPLPSYMIKKFDRASLETITQKGLKMNGYANVGFKTYSSSFYPKRSFNKIINYNLLNSDKFVDSNLDGLLDKINNNKQIKKMVEFYSINSEDNFDINNPKFDAITFRTIHNERKKRTKFV